MVQRKPKVCRRERKKERKRKEKEKRDIHFTVFTVKYKRLKVTCVLLLANASRVISILQHFTEESGQHKHRKGLLLCNYENKMSPCSLPGSCPRWVWESSGLG